MGYIPESNTHFVAFAVVEVDDFLVHISDNVAAFTVFEVRCTVVDDSATPISSGALVLVSFGIVGGIEKGATGWG